MTNREKNKILLLKNTLPQINSKIKDDLKVIFLLSCFAGNPVFSVFI